MASTERDLEKKIGSQAKTKLIISTIPKTEAEIEKDRETQKEEEQAILDDEMRKRRERVKAWQDEKSKRIAAEAAVINSSLLSALSSSHVRGGVESITNEEQTGATSSVPSEGGNDNSITLAPAAWNLEDDDDDDEKMGMQTGNIDVLEMDTDMPPLVTSRNSDASQGMLGQNLGSKTGVTVFDQMNPLKVRKMSIGGSSSPQGSSGSSSVKLEIKFDASSSGDNSDISILTSMELKSDESRTIKSTSGAIKVIASSSSSLVAALPAGEREREGIAPDFDPLDDFMSSLYGEGEVVEQRGLPSDNSLQKLEFERFKSNGLLLSGGSIYGVQGNSVDGSRAFMGRRGEGQYDSQNISMSVTEGKENAQRPSDSLSVTDEDDDGYSFLAGSSHGGENSRLNQFGSNFITLDQIMGSKSPSALGSSSSGSGSRQGYSSRVDYNNSGWESDSAPPSPAPKYSYSRGEISGDIDGETEGEREEREDKDRKEFIDAIRAARAAEEVVRERLKQKEEAAEKSKEQLGRVFAGEGDVMDENDIEEKKKSALEILEEAKKGKELKPIDHKAIEYIPFRKNLYIVPRALSKLTEEDLTEKREDLQIKVRGKGCPAPVDTWGQCGLSERVLGVIEKLGLDAPFAIQKQAIPAIMCGRDLIGVAKTGSGKTLAFLLPMFRHIMDQPPLR